MRAMTARYQALRGTRDILPDEVAAWRFLEETTHEVFSRYGFREIGRASCRERVYDDV